MIKFTQGNLLEAQTQALVNTVNTVGVMGKGIALMFKERFPTNFQLYAQACKANEIEVGKMFVTEVSELGGLRWIINFPTKQHWQASSQMKWIIDGLQDLRKFLVQNNVKSVAIPPLGSGNGGLIWNEVREHIENTLKDLEGVDIIVYEPTPKYQNVAKSKGTEKLTPARALITELVRRYWILGMECSLLEIQKLAWFLQRAIKIYQTSDPLKLDFEANKYGPYAYNLNLLLNHLDGSYLHCQKRIADASPLDVIWFDDKRKDFVLAYLKSEAKEYLPMLEHTAKLVNGFESPYGMELLATIDWLLLNEKAEPNVASIRAGISAWPAGQIAADRKARIFNNDRAIEIALNQLKNFYLFDHNVCSS